MKAEKEAREKAERALKAKAEAEEAKRRQEQENSEVISKKQNTMAYLKSKISL